MKKRIFILFALLTLLGSWGGYAQEEPVLDEATKKLCNEAILNIYQTILKEKGSYKELAQFDERVLYENKYGIYTLVYEYRPSSEESRPTPYSFGVTIDAIEDTTFRTQRGAFAFSFPALGLKIAGYQNKHLLRTQYNILPLINENGGPLLNHQQSYLPLRLYLKSPRETYKPREDIVFEVELKNVSKRHMVVRSLSRKTLFFLINNEFWGTTPTSRKRGGKKIVLKAGQSLDLSFKGESFQYPQDVEIYGVYRMSIKGVNPSGVLKLKIAEE